MKKKYFFKNQSSLRRQFIAGGLTAAFAFSTVGSGFAEAMEQEFCLNLEKLGVYLSKETTEKIYNYGGNKNNRAELVKKGIYTRYLGFETVGTVGETSLKKPEKEIFDFKEGDKEIVDFIEINWEEIDKLFPKFVEICESVYFPGEDFPEKVKYIFGEGLVKEKKFPALRRDLIFQYFKYCKELFNEDCLEKGLKGLDEF